MAIKGRDARSCQNQLRDRSDSDNFVAYGDLHSPLSPGGTTQYSVNT